MKLTLVTRGAWHSTSLIPLAFVLYACSASQAPSAGDPALLPTIVEPTVRSVQAGPANLPVAPTQAAPTQPATAPTAIPQLASSGFRDDFNGALDPGWTWYQNDAPGWTLSNMPGWLRLNLSKGSFFSATPPANVLVRPAPPGDFDLQTWLRFSPFGNFEIAGLVVIFDDHSVLQLGRGFCRVPSGSDGCLGDGLYFDNIQNSTPVGGNFATPSSLGVDYLFRLERQSDSYAATYSTDGSTWVPLGTHSVDRNPVSVGLIAAQAKTAGNFADFDWFEIQSSGG
ncbi:MAG: hypothetical protein MUO23_04355 [Anaerolineales bacterium]|nr:hypothetical protein [Anaerolineales bacterium]